ncbi:hypothetical protein JW848_06485 [Candidatus Bipolaricaulota bacterium]|nr:hypothetical protein [Candidatus Bipolaricaulota bacterium]
MARRHVNPLAWILLAVVSAAISLLSALGVILASDTVGRVISAVAWAALAIVWLGRYFVAKKRSSAPHRANGP